MELQTISQVSRRFAISTRTLRYYEEIGLITPAKIEDFAYRAYDVDAVARLRQIVVLRKLRIPLKQIAEVLRCADARVAVEVFEKSLAEINCEITALLTIRRVLVNLTERLKSAGVKFTLPDDAGLLKVVDSLTVPKINFKEEKSMDQLNNANEKLTRLTDVRIVHLPPMTVAAASAVGKGCEGKANDAVKKFVVEKNLLAVKPDIRQFGFDCSAGKAGIGEGSYKYQCWVTIPDDIDVPAPLVKRQFFGGTYAAHTIKMGDFEHWALLGQWAAGSEQYEYDNGGVRCAPIEDDMDICLEETLNYFGNMNNLEFKVENTQFDLLLPVREKMK